MSAVGNQIAELYSSISEFQTEINSIEERHSAERTELNNKHKGELLEANAKFEKAKKEFTSYLKQAGIDTLLASTPATKPATKGKGKQASASGELAKDRKPRKSSDEKKATLELNKAIYTSTYPKGIDEKTGLPKRFVGRNPQNAVIDAQMKDDERDATVKPNAADAMIKQAGDLLDSLEQPAKVPKASKAVKKK